jgi:hypothetical protein
MLSIVKMSVIMLGIVVLNVVLLSAIMLSVVMLIALPCCLEKEILVTIHKVFTRGATCPLLCLTFSYFEICYRHPCPQAPFDFIKLFFLHR